MSRLPVEQLPARLKPIDLAGTEVHHLPDWKGYDDPKRLEVIRKIALMRGRDPRIASLAVSIIRKAKVKPREYKKQAAALLKWVQNPKNVYYVNEPGERLQDPIFTIKQGWGDCDDQVLVLCALFESVRLPWRLVIAGTCNGQKTRYIEGFEYPQGCKWSHIYCMVGVPPFHPKEWYYCETTIQSAPLGWDVVSGDKRYLPELDTPAPGPPRIARSPRKGPWAKRFALPEKEKRSPAYAMAYGDFQPSDYGQSSALGPMVGMMVGASIAQEQADSDAEKGKDKKSSKDENTLSALHPRKILPGVAAGILISVGTTVLLAYLMPKLGLDKKGK